MNLMMMLEIGTAEKDEDAKKEKESERRMTKIAGERGPLKNVERAKPIDLHNKFEELFEEVDIVDETEDSDAHELNDDRDAGTRKHKFNKRQRLRRKLVINARTHDFTLTDIDATHDDDHINDNNWTQVRYSRRDRWRTVTQQTIATQNANHQH